MTQEAVINVRLETDEARAALNALDKEGEEKGRRLGKRVLKTLGKGLSVAGLGGAFGAGLAAVRGSTHSGVGDIAREGFGGIGAYLNDFFLGLIDDDARAKIRARSEIEDSFALITGVQNRLPAGVQERFKAISAVNFEEEQGRSIIRRELYSGKEVLAAVVDQIADRFASIVTGAMEAAVKKITGIGS